MDVVRVFVGTSANSEDLEAQIVLENSIRSRSSKPLQITWMMLSRNEDSPFYSCEGRGWQTQHWATPFSGFRWIVPELCSFEGRAIYTDVDVIFRADISELWNHPIGAGKIVAAKDPGRFCVSVWDCAAAEDYLPLKKELERRSDGFASIKDFFLQHPLLVEPFRDDWNCLDGEDYLRIDDPHIKALHYSDMATQPHLRFAVPRLAAKGRRHWFDGKIRPHHRKGLISLFEEEYEEALRVGYRLFHPEEDGSDGSDSSDSFGPYVKASLTDYRGHKWSR